MKIIMYAFNKIVEHWKIAASVVGVLLIALIVVLLLSLTPKPKSNKPEDIAKFIGSSDFNRLTDKQQDAYIRQMNPDNNWGNMRQMSQKLTETQRRTMMDNMQAVREKKQIKELGAYMRMSKEEKNKFLDAKIAEFDQRMAEFAKRRAEREAQGGQQQRPPQGAQAGGQGGQRQGGQQGQRPNEAQRAARQKSRIESTAPEVRAARQKMMMDMMKRRQETGKSMPARPGGGGRRG